MPSVTNPSRLQLMRFMQRAAGHLAKGSRILNAGAGSRPYLEIFRPHRVHLCDRAYSAQPPASIAFACDLEHLPVVDGAYDAILCTQVLEHVAEPIQVLCQFHRALATGGMLWLTAPLYFEEHEAPRDFFRFTQFGLRLLLEKAGFEVLEIDWLEGYYGTLAYELHKAARCLPGIRNPTPNRPVGALLGALFLPLRFAFAALSWLFGQLEIRVRLVDRGHPKNYAVVARKGRH